MLRDWTIGKKVTARFVFCSLALAIVGFVAYRAMQNLADGEMLVAHTHQVQSEIAQFDQALLEAETSVRGFVITGSPEFLSGWESAADKVRTRLETFKSLTRDNATQQDRWKPLPELIKQRLTKLAAQIDHRRSSDPAQMYDLRTATSYANEGRNLMAEIRDITRNGLAHEDRLLGERAKDAESSRFIANAVILFGVLFAVLVSILIGTWTARSLGRQIGSAIQSMQSSSAELQSAANQQATSATEQVSAMNEIATTISELLATSRQIADSAQRVSQIASQTVQAARGGDTIVARTNEVTAGLRKQVDQIVTHMLDLGKRSQQIGTVLDVVSELAEQTNILAINASIEAAGAGDAGRRFGVVADEIRKLADRVTGSTKEIRVLIDDVRSAVNTTVMATETGSKAVDAGAVAVSETAAQFKQIASMVATTTDAAREIELSTKQQSTAVEQVNIAISSVAQAARETESSATQTLQTSVRLTELSKDLLRIVEQDARS